MQPVSTAGIIERSWNQTLVVGHRGSPSTHPENTLPGFEEAIRVGAEATECDVHLSKDGEVVIMHDGTLDRTTSLKGPVKETPWALMRDVGVPRLSDLTRVTKNRIVVVVEIKDGYGIEPKIVDHLKEQKMVDQSIVFSFHAERVARVKTLNPEQFSVWLVGRRADPANLEPIFASWKESKADGIGVQFRNCSPELAAEARRRRIPLFVWTVPPGEEVDRLKALRANFIITDHPEQVKAQLAR